MNNHESYTTKTKPGIEDWIQFNQAYFDALKGKTPTGDVQYAPLTDVDVLADSLGLSTEELFRLLKERVGNLGSSALKLTRSEMDGASHVVIGDNEQE